MMLWHFIFSTLETFLKNSSASFFKKTTSKCFQIFDETQLKHSQFAIITVNRHALPNYLATDVC